MTLLSNQTVTFRKPKTNLTLANVPVLIYRASRDAKLYPFAERYEWCVCWDSNLAYTDGTSIGALHEIVWSELKNTGNFAVLKKPRKTFGVLPTSCAYFMESEG